MTSGELASMLVIRLKEREADGENDVNGDN